MRVWDLPLRIFHWSMVAAVIGAVASSKADVMWLHERFGLSVMGLIAFRLIWGFVGGYYARFRQFITAPKTALAGILDLLKAEKGMSIGHSAAAGYAVIGLLGVLGYQALTGSISNDDVLFEGPLAHLLPSFSNLASDLHDIGEPLLIVMIALGAPDALVLIPLLMFMVRLPWLRFASKISESLSIFITPSNPRS